MPIAQLDPNLIRSDASAGTAKIEADAIDLIISKINEVIDEVVADISGTANRVAKFTAATTLGDSSITDTGTLVTFATDVDINGRLLKIGDVDGYTYIDRDTIGFGYASDAEYTGYLNYRGYANGATQFRNLIIADGKGAAVATFTGSTKLTALAGSCQLDGDLDHNGTNVGFYGTAPIAKQTGVAVTAAAIHAALVNLGLIAA